MITANKKAEATVDEVDRAMRASWQAFSIYKKKSLTERAAFLKAIAAEMDAVAEALIQTAHGETNLAIPRLKVELKRTLFQLTSYAKACEEGTWLDIRIDTDKPSADLNKDGKSDDPKKQSRPGLRKMLVPLGPVVVFGASNFPFAYSTAGGDTACALAAGCPVVIKAHSAHAETSKMVADAVQQAAAKCALPSSVFIHIESNGFEAGTALVQHPLTKAVGFTGSFEGGKTLFDLANKRPVPIPVFAEMGSVNPVFILPKKLRSDTKNIAAMYAASITLSAGQFCTNPGILVGIDDEALSIFEHMLGEAIQAVHPEKMLHAGIAKSFHEKRSKALAEKGVKMAYATQFEADANESIPTLAQVPAKIFLENPLLHKEVFGPYSLLVKCRDVEEMLAVARNMDGQLTTTLMAEEREAEQHRELVDALMMICGRFILNGVPTGVEVALSMHHGGPYPATTDSRFTAVGADGIKRFARPLCFQNWSNDLLPPELKDENPLQLWRTVNTELTKRAV
ncbi:MAG TPA: aldehyde dehydrogenase (NADP(+)) [Flavisolibacter sp.]|nr:aldehyde dehydrogenase (NADP(+)) [Flavisolibacter sp.]